MTEFPRIMRQRTNARAPPIGELASIVGSPIVSGSGGYYRYAVALADGRTATYELTSDEDGHSWRLVE